ncbi:MAG TPA: peroxidase family protein [Chthoniobacterales bacterium]|nr:peroxidase family protein [Chthoniobacterales bacterium]
MTDDLIKRLTALAASMLVRKDMSPIPTKIHGADPAHAGYTYFGQFIDHNLTEDDTPLKESGKQEPWETFNHRGPWLNLSGIYSPTYDRGRWKELFQSDGLSFRLGKPAIDGKKFDLPLDRKGFPVIADERNNENIIVRQIHVMFLKLHNLAIKELEKRRGLTDAERFAKARRRVCWQYQYLVRHDFLLRTCRKSVFHELVEKNQSQIDWSKGFSIPIESAQAALRFGHSMVRSTYQINLSHSDIALRDLLCSGEARALEPDEVIHWPTFLTGEPAMLIDTAVVHPLFGLESKDIHSFVDSPMPHLPHSLPVRTLLRGAQNCLPTGQDVAKRMGVPLLVIPAARNINGLTYDPGAHLRSTGFTEATPLWYYLLLEAEVNEKGATLGELGSRLVIETVNGALRNDPDSYLSQKPDWTPKPWKKTGKPVLTLLDLAVLLGA